jgi:hypothetical protein
VVERILRIIKLDFSVFKEIESDPQATVEAAIIVAVTILLSAISSAVTSDHAVGTFVITLVNGLVGWVVWSAVTFFVGKTMFRGGGTLEQMLRVIGYAHAPRILSVLRIIPCVGWIGALAGFIISLIAGVMAVREALDVELGTALVVVAIGFVVMIVVNIVIGLLLGSIFAISAGATQMLFGQ